MLVNFKKMQRIIQNKNEKKFAKYKDSTCGADPDFDVPGNKYC